MTKNRLLTTCLFCAALFLPVAPHSSASADDAGSAAEATAMRGVAWLRLQADEAGRFSMMIGDKKLPNPGYTAIALAPIVAALPHDKRASDALVKKSLAYLLASLKDNGAISSDMFRGYENYLTSATLMATTRIDDPALAAVNKKMADYLLTLQRTEEGRNEGWFGYNKRRGADLSNAQFTIEALRSAGIPEDHPAMVRARAYLSRVQNRSENEENDGKVWETDEAERGEDGLGKVKVRPGNDGSAGYEPGVSKAGMVKLPDGTFIARGYGSMTYALLKSYVLTSLKADDPRLKACIDWLGKNTTWDENPGFRELAKETGKKDLPYQGLYYYYMTAARALDLAEKKGAVLPESLKTWRVDLSTAIEKRQKDDGHWVNDMHPRWDESNPVLTTSYALLALQAIHG
ncbi:MAG: hypothetical protein V3T86_01975 [Planctomycetota bacterium]